MKKLDSGSKWILRLHAYGKILAILFVIIFIFLRIFLELEKWDAFWGFIVGHKFVIALVLILFIIIAEGYAQLGYMAWEYDITSTEVRVNKGIIWKKSTSIPYEKIQNVEIRRGIIARIFGFSEIMIQTAGNSGGAYANKQGFNPFMAEGYLPGVSVEESEKTVLSILKNIKDNKDI